MREDADMGLGGQEPGEAQARLSLLVEASARMAKTLDLRQVVGELAATVVPAFADRAQVDLVPPLLRPGTVIADESPLLMCRVTDVASGTVPGPTSQEEDWHSYLPRADGAQVLETGVPRTVTGPEDSSVLLVPLAARGRRLGLLTFVRDA